MRREVVCPSHRGLATTLRIGPDVLLRNGL
jgi:hypothetical protein